MEDFRFNNCSSPVSSDLRAVLTQIRHTQKIGKAPTIENIISYGSGLNVPLNVRRTEIMQAYLQELVSGGYVDFENGRYPLTDAGRNLLSSPNALPDIDPHTSARQRANYGRAMKCTRAALGTGPKYYA